MASTKKITLRSSDAESFEVDETVVIQSQTINHMIQDGCADSVIPPVTSKILAKVIEYCKKHVETASKPDDRTASDELKSWDADFVKVDQPTLFDLILVSYVFRKPEVSDIVIFKATPILQVQSNIKDSNII